MPTKEAITQVLNAAVLGDEAAIEALAQFLEQRAAPQVPQVNEALQQSQAKYRFREKVYSLADEYPVLDKRKDPAGFAAAMKRDAKLFAKSPEMDEDLRLRKVAEQTSAAMGDLETRYNSADIAKVVAGRRTVVSSPAVERAQLREEARAAAEREADGEDESDELSEMDRYNSGIIQKMERDRKTMREVVKPGERPRMTRAVPFPTDDDYGG